MKKIEFNKDNLEEKDIDKVVKKVRGIILNKKGQALIAKYADVYLLVGGSIDEGETPQEALEREIKEEASITTNIKGKEPFLEIESYDKDYYDRKEKRKLNRLTITQYYETVTEQEIDENKQTLTESEKQNEFKIWFENLSKIQYLVEQNVTENPKRKIFDREILTVLREFAKYKDEIRKYKR